MPSQNLRAYFFGGFKNIMKSRLADWTKRFKYLLTRDNYIITICGLMVDITWMKCLPNVCNYDCWVVEKQ